MKHLAYCEVLTWSTHIIWWRTRTKVGVRRLDHTELLFSRVCRHCYHRSTKLYGRCWSKVQKTSLSLLVWEFVHITWPSHLCLLKFHLPSLNEVPNLVDKMTFFYYRINITIFCTLDKAICWWGSRWYGAAFPFLLFLTFFFLTVLSKKCSSA